MSNSRMFNVYDIANKVEVQGRGRITRGFLAENFLNKNLISIGEVA